jgi:membrane-bound metal-dependent hydrolase YbcI (DUF457 family)
MFIGHFAVGFASKRWAPRTSFGILLLAPLLADVLWPVFVAAGLEHARLGPAATPFLVIQLDDYPWSHSLLMLAVWALLLGGAVRLARKDTRAALVVALGVLSHWVLDWVTHRPDMPLVPGGAEYGLELWSSVRGTIAVEVTMFVVGVALYATATRAKDRIGHLALWSFVGLLGVMYVANVMSPPPPSMRVVAVFGIVASVLFPTWAWWLDRHRDPVR